MAGTRTSVDRKTRIDGVLSSFYERPVYKQVEQWRKMKNAFMKTPKGQCVVCKFLEIPRGLAGIGTKFEETVDGELIAICGGRDGDLVCPGLKIQREAYIDRATVTKEVLQTQAELRKDLKHIRDRVLATETLTKEDRKEFGEMTEEYQALKTLEERYHQIIQETTEKDSVVISTDDVIEVPEAYFGPTEGLRMVTPMIPTIKKDAMVPSIFLDTVTVALCKEDLPVPIL
jgi:hypothetical protein